MHSDSKPSALAAALAALALLVGCATQSGSGAAQRAEPVEAASERARETRESAQADTRTAPAEIDGGDAIAEILAERRRADYPEIEFQDAGFTITEQARIGSDARTDYERAISLLRQERHAEGIALLRAVTEMTPDATAPYIDLGIAYRQLGELDQAEASLKTAELLSPDNPVVHNELGIVYRRSGRFAEARASYERALAVFGEFHYARRNLAVLCDLYLADPQCAVQNYRAYLESVGSDAEVEIWVADLENRLGN